MGTLNQRANHAEANTLSPRSAPAVGHEITTVEGLGTPEKLSPVQAAFAECDAFQCGFCTPGFVVASTALLKQHPNPSLAEIKAGLAGNVCRCGTYSRIFEAVNKAANKKAIAYFIAIIHLGCQI